MKKILFFIICFFSSVSISFATNHIYNIDISVYIDEYGNAQIKEIWDVKGSDGTEWYKVLGNLGNSELNNFTVSMDGKPLTYKTWDVDESLREKRGYYGINYGKTGKELCFGKYDYNKHTFTLNYTLSNFIFNVEDAQVIYFNFIDRLSSVDFENFSIEISTYYDMPNTLDVWGYGHKGYAYVENGKIKLSNASDMNGKYVVLLAKFPLNTFNTTNSYSKYNTFNDVYNLAEEGTFDYDYNSTSTWELFLELIGAFFQIIFSLWPFIIVCFISYRSMVKNRYGYIDNKKIDKENTPYFRDIPCNKDIYYANALSCLNGWTKNETNILGAIFLKWIKTGVVTVKKENEKRVSLILNNANIITNRLEVELYDMVYKASKDGILESKELEKWAKRNYSKFLNLFTKIKDEYIKQLKEQNFIFKRENKEQCKYKNVMNDTLYEESKKLYGLKLFLDEFSNIDKREAIEVNIWDEYLMFAYIFGNATKVMKQFKNLYPEVIEEMNSYNLDFDTLIILNNISVKSVSAASSARSAAQSYSSGGGGFSSGGGGGGSFGGGGGGSR